MILVGFLVLQKLSSRSPLMAAASRGDLGLCRDATVAAYSSLYSSLDDSRTAVAGTGAERAHSASPHSSNEQV